MKSFTAASMAIIASSAMAQYAIDPNSVDDATRQFWCTQQEAQCPLICLDQGAASGTTESNTCDADSLTYSCVCDNGLSPNVSQYSQTMPYYICTEWGNQCVSNAGSDTAAASACRQDHPCGAQNPTRQNTSTLTRTMSQTTTTGLASGQVTTTDADGSAVTVYTGYAGTGGASSTAGSGNNGGDESSAIRNVRVWALSCGQTFGTLGVVGAAALGFAVLL